MRYKTFLSNPNSTSLKNVDCSISDNATGSIDNMLFLTYTAGLLKLTDKSFRAPWVKTDKNFLVSIRCSYENQYGGKFNSTFTKIFTVRATSFTPAFSINHTMLKTDDGAMVSVRLDTKVTGARNITVWSEHNGKLKGGKDSTSFDSVGNITYPYNFTIEANNLTVNTIVEYYRNNSLYQVSSQKFFKISNITVITIPTTTVTTIPTSITTTTIRQNNTANVTTIQTTLQTTIATTTTIKPEEPPRPTFFSKILDNIDAFLTSIFG
jgi:hypothetical protein